MAQRLSDRERQVLDLAARGQFDESIGRDLEISVATVRGYWLRIRSKLGGSSRAELVGKWVALRAEQLRADSDCRHDQDIAETEIATDASIAAERAEMDKILAVLSESQRNKIEVLRSDSDERRRLARQAEASDRKSRRDG